MTVHKCALHSFNTADFRACKALQAREKLPNMNMSQEATPLSAQKMALCGIVGPFLHCGFTKLVKKRFNKFGKIE